MRPTAMVDGIHRSIKRKRYGYLASFAIKGAFDVSRSQLVRGLGDVNADVHARRAIRDWLEMRAFQVNMANPMGTCFSSMYPTRKGPP